VTEQELRASHACLSGDVTREGVPHQVRMQVRVNPGASIEFFNDGAERLP
jgi:hypothetical protein